MSGTWEMFADQPGGGGGGAAAAAGSGEVAGQITMRFSWRPVASE